MASLITGSSAISRSPVWAAKGNSAVSKSGNYLFYSDNPESVTSSCLADAGYWLNMSPVSGAGQVYLWHTNNTGYTINHCLLIYNPNSFQIKVSSSNYGRTNQQGAPDSAAWASYFSGNSTSVTIAPGSYGNLFLQSVSSGNNFGVVARTNVTNSSTGAAASAYFYDLAYQSNSGNAGSYAPTSGTQNRGLAPTFYTSITFATIAPTSTDGTAYQIAGGSTDVFGTGDLVYVTDGGGKASGWLEGNYGQQMSITMTIQNSTGYARNFHIYMGAYVDSSAFSFPFVNMNGSTAMYEWIKGKEYVDIIDTGSISSGGTATISFFTVVPAISSTPFAIGACPI